MRVFDFGGRVFFSVVFVFSAPFLCTKKAIAAEKLGYAVCKRIMFLCKCVLLNCLGLFCLLIPAEKLVWCESFFWWVFFLLPLFFSGSTAKLDWCESVLFFLGFSIFLEQLCVLFASSVSVFYLLSLFLFSLLVALSFVGDFVAVCVCACVCVCVCLCVSLLLSWCPSRQ